MSRPVKKKDGQAKGKSRSIERCSIATLTPDEAKTVLDDLLRMHPELQEKAEVLAANAILAPTYEDLADEVFQAITDIDLGDLNDRAGPHSWGYVEPTEAAQELLEESLKDVLDDMKRQVTLGFVPRAEAICLGIVEGLYRARKTNSDGALGWAPDFPIEYAGYALQELMSASNSASMPIDRNPLLEKLVASAPEWKNMLIRTAADPCSE